MKILQYKEEQEFTLKGTKLAVEGKEYNILYKYIDFKKYNKLPANILIAKVEEIIKKKKVKTETEEIKEEGGL